MDFYKVNLTMILKVIFKWFNADYGKYSNVSDAPSI